MRKLFPENAIISENRALNGELGYLKLILAFLMVFFAGSLAASVFTAVAQSIYVLSDASVVGSLYGEYTDFSELIGKIEELFADMPAWFTAVTLASNAAVIFAAVFYCRKFEHRRAFAIGFYRKNAVWEYLAGLFIGVVMFACVYGIGLLSGEITFTGVSADIDFAGIVMIFFGFVIQGAEEEILMRSFVMVSASRCRGGVPAAIGVNSLIFAALHLMNNGITPLAFANLFLFGVFASVYFLRRGSIWGVAAIHTAWNFVQGNVFGCPVSGMGSAVSVFGCEKAQGIFTGGAFGPEGGLAVTFVLIAGILALLPMKNRLIEVPPFRVKGSFYSIV